MAESNDLLRVLAPLSGVRVPLSRVPDAVFAERMVGDGASLDPTSSTVLAPIDGEVVQLHAAHHAITLRHRSGVDILIHVGIDTVSLRGEGFTPMVRIGDRVSQGQGLIRFDLDQLACTARSLLTQVVVADGDRVDRLQHGRGALVAGRSLLFSLSLKPGQPDAGLNTDHATAQRGMVNLPNPAGLHARPAAVLAEAAKRFRADVRLRYQGREANAKSVVGLMSLGTTEGCEVELWVSGPDARQALEQLSKLLGQGCGEDVQAARAEQARRSAVASPSVSASDTTTLQGVPAAPGIAIGRLRQWRRSTLLVTEAGQGAAVEQTRLAQALHQAEQSLRSLQATLGDPARGAILAAQCELLQDPDLLDASHALIDQGKSAAFAWQSATEHSAQALGALGNPLLAERAADLRDVGRRVVAGLVDESESRPSLPPDCILIADELTPSETAQLDRQHLRGFCTRGGGATGHVAILARAFGLPAICGIDAAALNLADGLQVILDGDAGILYTQPNAAQLAEAEQQVKEAGCRAEQERLAAQAPAHTADGQRIEVVANVRHAADTSEAIAAGAEGVGLLRSELLFDQRNQAPDEAEQITAYAAVANCLGPDQPLVIRTLDVGGDKPLSYLPMAREDNPFLGLRGIRFSLAHPELLRPQVRAILRAIQGDAGPRLHLMLPMVATLEEWRTARGLIAAEAAQLDLALPALGIMIEVPSAALLAEQFAREVDFMSIGSNDLTQYTLAMDRGHAQLAAQADALHPPVLRLIGLCGQAMQGQGKWLGVCGALASDPLAVPALLGLGVTELSVVTPAIAAVKAAVSRCRLDQCRQLAQELVALDSAAAVRARLHAFRGAEPSGPARAEEQA